MNSDPPGFDVDPEADCWDVVTVPVQLPSHGTVCWAASTSTGTDASVVTEPEVTPTVIEYSALAE